MVQARLSVNNPPSSKHPVDPQEDSPSLIDRILQKLAQMELPEKEHFSRYLRQKWRMNHKPQSLSGSFKAIELFLAFYASLGKRQIKEIVREDLEGFVEHEQDRGMKITSSYTRLKYVLGFLRFLKETKNYGKQWGFLICTTPPYSPQSNGLAEAFVKTFKRDYVYTHELLDAESVIRQLPGWFEDYNQYAPHSGLKYHSPWEYQKLDNTLSV